MANEVREDSARNQIFRKGLGGYIQEKGPDALKEGPNSAYQGFLNRLGGKSHSRSFENARQAIVKAYKLLQDDPGFDKAELKTFFDKLMLAVSQRYLVSDVRTIDEALGAKDGMTGGYVRGSLSYSYSDGSWRFDGRRVTVDRWTLPEIDNPTCRNGVLVTAKIKANGVLQVSPGSLPKNR